MHRPFADEHCPACQGTRVSEYSDQAKQEWSVRVMPKMKTNRAAAKRFRPTANGFKRNQSHRRHMLTSKSSKRKRQLRAPSMVSEQDVGRLAQLLPYAK